MTIIDLVRNIMTSQILLSYENFTSILTAIFQTAMILLSALLGTCMAIVGQQFIPLMGGITSAFIIYAYSNSRFIRLA